ncbi:MAG: PqqD family protein [Desertimonas sp.]
MSLIPRRVYEPNVSVDVADVDDECVLIHRSSGTYFGLDRVGSEIWGMLAAGMDPAAITIELVDRYHVDSERVRRDVDSLVTDLLAAELIRAR